MGNWFSALRSNRNSDGRVTLPKASKAVHPKRKEMERKYDRSGIDISAHESPSIDGCNENSTQHLLWRTSVQQVRGCIPYLAELSPKFRMCVLHRETNVL